MIRVGVVVYTCRLCGNEKVTYHDAQLCIVCDSPALEDAVWFIHWCYEEPE